MVWPGQIHNARLGSSYVGSNFNTKAGRKSQMEWMCSTCSMSTNIHTDTQESPTRTHLQQRESKRQWLSAVDNECCGWWSNLIYLLELRLKVLRILSLFRSDCLCMHNVCSHTRAHTHTHTCATVMQMSSVSVSSCHTALNNTVVPQLRLNVVRNY